MPVVASDDMHIRSLIYWVEIYNVEGGIYLVPNPSLLVDQYICTCMHLKEVETPEAAIRAIEQLTLYVLGFDPTCADQEMLYPPELCPLEIVNGKDQFSPILYPAVWGHFD
eukprot:scaffold30130_cov58-Attheya_sp.AAC.6